MRQEAVIQATEAHAYGWEQGGHFRDGRVNPLRARLKTEKNWKKPQKGNISKTVRSHGCTIKKIIQRKNF